MKLSNVQGLRAVAALLVVACHAHTSLDQFQPHSVFRSLTMIEAWGVDLFFVISGFIMISVHWADFGTPRAPARFLLRRVIRIVPMYWLLTLGLFALFWTMPSLVRTWQGSGANLALSLLLLLPRGHEPLLWVGWSLVFEMYFYYVFAASLTRSRTIALRALAGWAAVLLALQFVSLSDNAWYKTLTDGFVLEFLLGVLAGALIAQRRVPPALVSSGIGAAGIVWIVAAFVCVRDPAHELDATVPFRFFLIGVPMAMIVYAAVSLELRRRLVMPRPLLFLGDASYSIYLTHPILLVAIGRCISALGLREHVPGFTLILGVPLLVVLVGCAVYSWFERPLLAASRSFAERSFPSVMARQPHFDVRVDNYASTAQSRRTASISSR